MGFFFYGGNKEVNVALLSFSPTGNTYKVSKMIEQKLVEKKIKVQFIDITGNLELFTTRNFKKFLEQNIEEHDLLCIGGPVYADRMHYNILDVIKNLPKSRNGWSKIASVFVTYGGVSSGIALQDAARCLRKKKRVLVAGMKIDSAHSFNRLLSIKINEGKPNNEVLPIINDFCERIAHLRKTYYSEIRDVSKSFSYIPLKRRIFVKIIYNERFIHKFVYPKIKFDSSKCQKCNSCINHCPVHCIKMSNNGLMLTKSNSSCIHCGLCVEICPKSAITFDIRKIEGFLRKWSAKTSSHHRNEGVRSAVYPLKDKHIGKKTEDNK
ncbi:MAG: 4Fe-4S dicluster domain-containing protein [Candidatus Heimdallarchaeota archaeon]|nr:4Fe-4S dicluster domain-containing protein [Candidatus Heimdallarchaeota archaeon]